MSTKKEPKEPKKDVKSFVEEALSKDEIEKSKKPREK